MTDTLHQIKARANYLRHAHARGGFGVHSPFVFHWLNSVLYERSYFYAYQHLRTIRKNLKNDKTIVDLQGFGTASARKTKIKNIANSACTKRKFAELLFRIVNHSKAQNILELGTNLGLTTLHLAKANSQAQIVTLEGEPALHAFATQLFQHEKAQNINAILGDITETLPQALQLLPTIDIAFFDANHRYAPTIEYFQKCLPHAHANTLFIFDDIHRSKEMERAWNEIKSNPKIRVTIDIFQMGIAFFNTDLQKEDYIVAF